MCACVCTCMGVCDMLHRGVQDVFGDLRTFGFVCGSDLVLKSKLKLGLDAGEGLCSFVEVLLQKNIHLLWSTFQFIDHTTHTKQTSTVPSTVMLIGRY